MNKKSNKKLMAGLIALITLIIIGITCSGFLDNFKEGIKFLGISFGISAGLVLLLFIMKYIITGADKLVGEGRTFNDRAIVLFSILILVSLTCRGFLKNFTLGIVFLIVSIAFVSIAFLIMYGINSKKGAIKKVVLAEKTSGEKMFILLTILILVSLTCGGFIQNLKAGILFLIISIISSLALYLIVTEVKNENSIIGKIIRIETTFNQKMMILLSTIIMVSLTCGGFLRNLRAGIVFLMISIVFTASMLMLVLGVKSKHKIYDKIAGFETTFNEKMIILLTTMAMVSITSGGFLYNFKLGMIFLTISLIFSSLVLAGVISVKPRVNIFKMRARIENLGKKEMIRFSTLVFASVLFGLTMSGTHAYFTSGTDSNSEVKKTINRLIIGQNVFGDMLTLDITTSKDSPQVKGTKILIGMASSKNFESCELIIRNSDGEEVLKSVNTSSSIEWNPEKADLYTLIATYKDLDGNVARDSLEYIITDTTPAEGDLKVKVKSTLKSPQVVNTTINFTPEIVYGECDNKEITLTNSSGNVIKKSSSSIEWTPTEAGTYTITATASNSKGKTSTDTMTFIITKVPQIPELVAGNISTDVSSPQNVNKEITINVGTASGGTGTYSYEIIVKNSSGTEQKLSDSTSAKWTPTEAGTYTIKSTVTDSEGNKASSTEVSYVINSELKANLVFKKESPQEVKTSITLTPSASGGTGSYTYKITIINPSNGTEEINVSNSAIWTPTEAGTYTVKLTVTDSGGNTAIDTKEYTIKDSNKVTIYIAESNGYDDSGITLSSTIGINPLVIHIWQASNSSNSKDITIDTNNKVVLNNITWYKVEINNNTCSYVPSDFSFLLNNGTYSNGKATVNIPYSKISSVMQSDNTLYVTLSYKHDALGRYQVIIDNDYDKNNGSTKILNND